MGNASDPILSLFFQSLSLLFTCPKAFCQLFHVIEQVPKKEEKKVLFGLALTESRKETFP